MTSPKDQHNADTQHPHNMQLLYKTCRRKAKELQTTVEALKKKLVRELAFGMPLFRADPLLDSPPSAADSRETGIERAIGQGAKYRDLLELCAAAPTGDDVLFLVACWLKQEGIRQPEDWLPAKVYARLTSGTRKRLASISFNDHRYAAQIRRYLPYAALLLQNARRLRAKKVADPEQELLKLGYDRTDAELACSKNWTSEIAFTCEWLAARGEVKAAKARKDPDTARTLQNAYSRVFGKSAPRLISCAFCSKPAVSEFYGHDRTSASHCEDHSAEKLPRKSGDAWVDRAGRRWWNPDKGIRYDSPAAPPSST